MFAQLINLDIRTLMAVLFWGNLAAVIPIASYYFSSHSRGDRRLAKSYALAKVCQALAYLLLLSRGDLPDFFSVNLGNSTLFAGFYMEALSMLIITHEKCELQQKAVTATFILSLVVFNVVEFLTADSSTRVVIASVCVFGILFLPNIEMLLSPHAGQFKRTVGSFYTLFLLLQLPRAVYALLDDSVNIFTPFVIQVMTFLSLVLLLVFGLSTYLLFMKEKSDKIINIMATTDILTGLSNRYNFLGAAEAVFERHKHGAMPITLVFMDIDYFKKINDTYGHAFGDDVLKLFGEIIRTSLRAVDLSCRYGGEEFVALLAGADRAAASKAVARVAEQTACARFDEHPELRLACSIGVMSGVPAETDFLMNYIECADEAMYEAKRTGRNRIVHYEPNMQKDSHPEQQPFE